MLGAWQATITDEAGNIQENAQITVLIESSGGLASLWSDRDGTTPLSNPFTADADGFVRFYATGNAYRIDATLGSFTRTWRHVPIGTVGEYDQLPSTLVKYDRTAAEIAASVTPTDYAKWSGPIIDGARFGFNGDGVTLNDTPMDKAIDVCTELGGGVLMLGKGVYLFSANFELPESMEVWGAGILCTELRANGNFVLMYTNRNTLRDLSIGGNAKTGTGVQIGRIDFTGHTTFDKCRIYNFNVGVRFGAALYIKFYDCIISGNEYGVDYNAIDGSHYSNAIEFFGTTIQLNDKSGIAATSTPIRNTGLKFIGGSIEGNGTEAPATYPQVVLGALTNFYFNTYFEYSTAGTKPDTLNISSASNGEIAACFFNGSGTAIISSSGGCNNIFVHNCDFNGTTTKCINTPACANVTALDNEYDTTNTIDHATSSDITKRIAQQSLIETAHIPTIAGSSTAGTQTYSVQVMQYNRVENLVHFRGRVTMTAKDGATAGNLRISLPLTSVNVANAYATVALGVENLTLSASRNSHVGLIPPNAAYIEIMEAGSNVTLSNCPAANLQATTTIFFSGVYAV